MDRAEWTALGKAIEAQEAKEAYDATEVDLFTVHARMSRDGGGFRSPRDRQPAPLVIKPGDPLFAGLVAALTGKVDADKADADVLIDATVKTKE